MMKAPGAILLLAALLGSCEALPVEGENLPEANLKRGRCPKITPVMCLLPDDNKCMSDKECPGDEKCCYLPCGYGCTAPETDAPHPGTCPSRIAKCKLPLPPPNCGSDGECLKTEKCCNFCGKKCVPAVREKSGVCPTIKYTCMIIPLPRTCNSDSDCAGVQKCCQHGCGFGCKDPVTGSSIPA